MNHRSSTNAESMEHLSVKGTGSAPQQSNNFDGFRVESPGGSVQWTRKGFGLKKWRRIKRDCPLKDEAASVDDGSKLLKRGLTDLVNPSSKHVDLSSVEAMQSSEASVGSVTMLHHPGVANGFSPDQGFMFTLGQEIVSGSQEKLQSDTIKKDSEELVKADKEHLCSGMDSDLRSCDFVFSSGAVSVANHIEKDERLMMMNHIDKDPLADSVRILAALQEALCKEVQSFYDQPRNENSTSSGSQALILKKKIKHLEHKLKEARIILEAKEARIQELENSKIESELEGIFQRSIETEIVHLMLTRSLSSSLQVLKQPKKVHSLTEDLEPNCGNILGKTCKFSFYFLTQLILLVSILWFMVLQFSPASQLVIPT